jgi:hypothetical protein
LLRRANASRESMAAEEILDLNETRCVTPDLQEPGDHNLSRSSITFSIPLTTSVNRS